MNKVILCGRLTKDPNISYSSGERQMCIARYTLAVDRRGRRNGDNGENTSDFIPCVAFDKAAEFAEKYLKQGTKMLVTGHIQTGRYTNKDGQTVYTTDVIIEDQEFAESKSAASNNSNNSFASNFQKSESRTSSSDAGDGFMNIPDGVVDDNLPFN